MINAGGVSSIIGEYSCFNDYNHGISGSFTQDDRVCTD